MNRPADFHPTVREALARRAGFTCSFPGCGAPTIGPSDESEIATSNSGMACHIAAAASGGSARRVDKILTPMQLSQISNGIWMCYRHGKLIDTDEDTYTVRMLKTWKAIAELKAKHRHERGKPLDLDPKKMHAHSLPPTEIPIGTIGAENAAIGNALLHSCVADLWGKGNEHAIRDAAIEIAGNAFRHGNARNVKLRIRPLAIDIEDDGTPFDSTRLVANEGTGGGAASIEIIRAEFKNKLLFTYSRRKEWNVNSFWVVRTSEELEKLTPCAVRIDFEQLNGAQISIQTFHACEDIYVILPQYFGMSNAFRLPTLIASALPSGRSYVLVGSDLSDGAIALLNSVLPNAKVLNL